MSDGKIINWKIKISKYLATVTSLMILLSGCVNEEPVTSENSLCTLEFKNYLGNSENIHPKVIYFEKGWHGYKFWMAYTPYPSGSTEAENPCIAVSDNGINWSVPKGLSNPLATAPNNGYNSDTHLVYDENADRLECWWREYNRPGKYDAIWRRVSYDGVSWEPKELILPFNEEQKARLSPAVWMDKGVYKMIYSDGARLYYMVGNLSGPEPMWSEPQLIRVNWEGLRAWHQDVITDDDGNLEMVICAYGPDGNNNTADLYYVKCSPDFTRISDPILIVRRGTDSKDFDHRSIYRSSLVKVLDKYYLYYSAIDESWHRHMALLVGFSPLELRQISEKEWRSGNIE